MKQTSLPHTPVPGALSECMSHSDVLSGMCDVVMVCVCAGELVEEVEAPW